MKATEILRGEHETILHVLSALEKIADPATVRNEFDVRSAGEALAFLRGFGDRCHHGKEEQLFFPALAARGLPSQVGPLVVLKSEHEEGRALLARMADALADAKASKPEAFAAAARAYVALMRDHIDKENGVLFPMGDGMLPEAEQASLLRAFERFEHADMGPDAHRRFLDIAAGLCERWKVDRKPRAAATHSCCGHGTRCM
jgi:hemerythrin-like domain-containing protein